MRWKQKLSTIYLGMLSITLIIDFLNGQFSGLHIGEIFRILLVIISYIIIASLSAKKFGQSFLIALFLLGNVVVESLKKGAATDFMYNASMGMKTMLVFLIGTVLTLLQEKRRIRFEDVTKILWINALIGPGLFFLAKVFHLENASYVFSGSAVGSKAGFISLNTVNAALLIVYCYSIFHLIKERKMCWLMLSAYILIPMIGLGTKTALLTGVLVPALFLLTDYKKKSVWALAFWAVFVFTFVLVLFGGEIYDALEGILIRQAYRLQEADLITYLFSTRNLRLAKVAKIYCDSFHPLELLFGKGYYYFHTLVGATEGGGMRPIEMEWADIFASYGLIGMIYTYGYAVRSIVTCNKRKQKEHKLYYWTAILLLVYGSLAGHLFTEALSASLYAVVIGCCNQPRKGSCNEV